MFKAYKAYIKSLLFILCSFTCFSQSNPDVFGFRSHYGFIIPHSTELKPISDSNPIGLQLEWSKLRTNDKSWETCNCYAQTGVSFTYYNYGNPEQLGSAYNLIIFTEPYLTFKKDIFYSLRAGAGATYLTKVYDEKSNPLNTFFSTPLSFLILLSANVNYRISENYIISAGGYYNHISNGGMKQPNRGMNFPTLSLGISYTPRPEKLVVREKTESRKGEKDLYLRIFGTLPGTGSTDIYPEKRKLLVGITGGFLYNLTHTNAFNIGFETLYDGALKEKNRRSGEDYGHKMLALMLGHNFTFGKFLFNQQLGVYLHKPFPTKDKYLYQRYELLYKIGSKYYLGTSLKAHRHVADNFDLRFGITF